METPGDGRDWRDVFISPRMLKIDSATHREKDHHDSQREDAPASTFLQASRLQNCVRQHLSIALSPLSHVTPFLKPWTVGLQDTGREGLAGC